MARKEHRQGHLDGRTRRLRDGSVRATVPRQGKLAIGGNHVGVANVAQADGPVGLRSPRALGKGNCWRQSAPCASAQRTRCENS